MNFLIRLTLEDFGEVLNLPPDDKSNKKDPYNLDLNIQHSFASNNRHPNLALILFKDITKRISQKLKNDDHKDLEEYHDDIPLAKQDPPPTFSSTPPSIFPLSDNIILGAITSLIEEFRGFRTQVDDAFEHVNNNVSGLNSRMSRMEENVAFLMSQCRPSPSPQED
ncbi:hypothetical protein PVK06_004756 [Gossypium arboreum]|uniref:Uncharacterized protein n=1 Tax=Gossypium arboreum TaxID=29729 RepID=A0ABR0QTS9_GOSAR|nr:hypothetical protein PVK06_004756 [Gossypium arboreum]